MELRKLIPNKVTNRQEIQGRDIATRQWCFNRLIPARSTRSVVNVSPRMEVPPGVHRKHLSLARHKGLLSGNCSPFACAV
jgi:hypothetical protein